MQSDSSTLFIETQFTNPTFTDPECRVLKEGGFATFRPSAKKEK